MSRGCRGPAGTRGGAVTTILILSFICHSGCDRDTRQAQVAAAGGNNPAAPASQGFNGVFHATVDGHRNILNLSERGGRITGVLGSAAIDANLNDTERASGNLRDPGTGAILGSVEMSLDRDRLELTMTVLNPHSGQKHAMPAVRFTRGVPPPVDVQLDAQLVGRWRQGSPGDDAASHHVWLIMHPDGSVEHGRSPVSGEPTLASVSGSGDDGFWGRWRTSDRTLYVMPMGNSQWIPFARYETEGAKLLLTHNDGSAQTYQRK